MTNRKLTFPVVKPPKLRYQPFGIKVLEEQAVSAAIDRIVRQRLKSPLLKEMVIPLILSLLTYLPASL